MSIISPSLLTNTASQLEDQNEQLRVEASRKEEQLENLKQVGNTLIYQAERVNQATLQAQELLSQENFRTSLQHQLQTDNSLNPLVQLQELMQIAKQVQTGRANQKLKKGVEDLNKKAGETLALAKSLEENVERMKKQIANLRGLNKARRRTINLSETTAQEIRKP
jgi:hypothetical protein